MGLGYLNLNRSARSLSGGEAQRIRLATQIGSQLVNVLYILDEPSIGLHQRDNARLIDSLKQLRDIGNSVIVVEHDKDMIQTADFILDIGPKAGIHRYYCSRRNCRIRSARVLQRNTSTVAAEFNTFKEKNGNKSNRTKRCLRK